MTISKAPYIHMFLFYHGEDMAEDVEANYNSL